MQYEKILAGVVAGLGYSIVGWQKETQNSKKGVGLDWLKLGKSVIICGFVGGIAGWIDQDIDVLMTGFVGVGVTKLVSLGWKIAFKKKKK